jgi:hypothetical protein
MDNLARCDPVDNLSAAGARFRKRGATVLAVAYSKTDGGAGNGAVSKLQCAGRGVTGGHRRLQPLDPRGGAGAGREVHTANR